MPNPVYLGDSVYASLKPEFEAKPSKKTNIVAPGKINAPSAIGNFLKLVTLRPRQSVST
jgi:hypothetical protein